MTVIVDMNRLTVTHLTLAVHVRLSCDIMTALGGPVVPTPHTHRTRVKSNDEIMEFQQWHTDAHTVTRKKSSNSKKP